MEAPSHPPVVLVTGAARRVGAEIARCLHGAGAAVAIHFRGSRDEAMALATALNELRPGSADVFCADLREAAALAGLIDGVVTRFGCLDVLVNNASSFYRTPVGTIDEAAWGDLVGSNFKAPLFLSQAAAPQLRLRRGCIVNITDVHAERPLKGYPLYSAAKAGLLGLTRALAQELAPEVRVNAVAPGPIAWPENETDFPPEERAGILALTPLGRTGTPADIATAVRFLAFDSPYVTGQVLNVDGGRTARL